MATSDTKNVKLGVCKVIYGGVDLGYTQGGVEVTVKTDTHKVNVDQFGKSTINEFVLGRDVSVKTPLAETTLNNLVAIMPGAKLIATGGSVATGTVTIVTNPTDGDTILINGSTVKFKSVLTGAPNEVLIGLTAAATAAALATALEVSDDVAIAAATYSASGAIVTVTFGDELSYSDAGASLALGNNFTLGAGTAGVKVTISGATLTGGTDPTSKRVDVANGIGINLLSIAKELRLHPKVLPDADMSEDFVIPLAATAGALKFAYKLENERIFDCDFIGYPDSVSGRLFYVGS